MENMIICGDTIEELKKLPSNSVDLIFSDPPYWMRTEGVLTRVEGTAFNGCNDEWDKFSSLQDYDEFTESWVSECYRVLKPNGSFWVIGGMQCVYAIGSIMQKLGFWFINDVIWHKKNPTPNFMGTRLNNSHETLIWATKSKKSKFTFNYKTAKELNTDTVSLDEYSKGIRKQLGSVWRISVCQGEERIKDENGNKLHNTQKPEELLYRIIAISSSLGDVVLDPFGGTMTTGAMAKKLGRKYIMIEKEPSYCQAGKERIDKIEFIESDIALATFDKKPQKVTMLQMIEAGYFIIGEPFYFRNGDSVAILMDGGLLSYNGEILDMHSCAAFAKGVKAKRLNGFDVWFVVRDGKKVSINEIRNNYRASLLG